MSRLALCVRSEHARVEPRVRYAFALFALAHGHDVVPSAAADHVLEYGTDLLPATPHWRPLDTVAPMPFMHGDLPCHHPLTGGRPDALAEIFEWASLAHEHASPQRDDADRIPSSDTLAIRANLSPTVPWGSRWIDALHTRLERHLGITSAARPLGAGRRMLAASHDVDFLPTSPADTARRLAVWAVTSVRRFGDVGHALRIATAGSLYATRGRLEHGLVDIAREEHRRGIRATYTWLVRDEHPRDARYDASGTVFAQRLAAVAALGHEHALHGSYTSLETPGRLAEEYDRLRRFDADVSGGRQHWLRFDDPAALHDELIASGATYDATAGFSDRIGFRTGIAHPHPLYDLRRDQTSPIIEIPTPIMDVAVADRSTTCDDWRDEIDQVLDAVDQHVLGGVSLLWHDPVVQGVQLPDRFASLYWDLHDADRHDWVPLRDVDRATRARVGELPISSRPTHPLQA